MTPAPVPADEADRLNALRDLLLLDTPPEERYDRLARFVAEQLNVPIALLTLWMGNASGSSRVWAWRQQKPPVTSPFAGTRS